jgi:hypothetical protein
MGYVNSDDLRCHEYALIMVASGSLCVQPVPIPCDKHLFFWLLTN